MLNAANTCLILFGLMVSPLAPHCGNMDAYKFSDNRRYKCKGCKKQFTVTVGTIFEGSHIPLQKWFMAIYLLTAHKKGISSLQLSRDLDITQKSAWYVLHRLRYAFRQKSFLAPLNNVVEIDECWVGGKETNKHAHKRSPKNESKKAIVFGLLERNGEVRTQTVQSASNESLMPVVWDNVAKGATIMTDEARYYSMLKYRYQHESISHSAGE